MKLNDPNFVRRFRKYACFFSKHKYFKIRFQVVWWNFEEEINSRRGRNREGRGEK